MIKLKTNASAMQNASRDIIEAAVEAIDAYQNVIALGADISELDTVICNIAFARDSIKANGAKWYIDNCDPENTFKDVFGLKEISDEKYIAAAEEGLGDALRTMWHKIREFFARIAKWFKDLFNKPSDTTKVNEDTKAKIEEAKKVEEEVKKDTSNPEAQKKDIKQGIIKRSVSAIKRFFKRKAPATEAVGLHVDDGYVCFTIAGAQGIFKEMVKEYRAYVGFSKKSIELLNSVIAINPESDGSLEKIKDIRVKTDELVTAFKTHDEYLINNYEQLASKYLIEKSEPITLGEIGVTKIEDINPFYNFANELNKWANGSEFKTNVKMIADAADKVDKAFKSDFPEGSIKHQDTDANRCLREKFDILIKLGNIARHNVACFKCVDQSNEQFAAMANDIANAALKELKK